MLRPLKAHWRRALTALLIPTFLYSEPRWRDGYQISRWSWGYSVTAAIPGILRLNFAGKEFAQTFV
jgi:hypothetical protein